MSIRLPVLSVAVLVMLSTAIQAHAAIEYLTQRRFIEFSAFVNGQPEGSRLSAQNFDDFNATVTRNFSQNTGSSTASQVSRLREESITLEGLTQVTTNVTSASFQIFAISTVELRFRLDAASNYRLNHGYLLNGAPIGFASARLVRSGTVIFDWEDSTNNPNPWPATPRLGVLSAGEYDLAVTVGAVRNEQNGAGVTQAGLNFAMVIPAPPTAALLAMISIAMRARKQRKRLLRPATLVKF
jgi:hypothetical protein